MDTGGVPLTGFKLYSYKKDDETTVVDIDSATLAFDGSGQPDVTEYMVEGLELDADYSFFVTALNPDEGPQSETLTVRAAGFPLAPSAITEIVDSRTGSSIGLEWSAADTAGSDILSYTLAIVIENDDDQVVYHGSST